MRKLITAVVVLVAWGASLSAQAQTAWVGGTSQDWNDAGNWSAGLPTGAGAVWITNTPSLAYSPYLTNDVSLSGNMYLASYTANGTQVGTAQLNQTAGTLTTSGRMLVGWSNAGNDGTYNVSGSGSASVGKMFLGQAGGTGTLTIDTSGTVATTDTGGGGFWEVASTIVGYDVGGSSISLVNGTYNNAGEMWLGAFASGGGVLNQSGGQLNVGTDLHLGRYDNASGTVNLTGGEINVGGKLWISHASNNGNVNTGLMNVDNATVNVENDVILGYAGNSSASGTLNINNGGVVNVATVQNRWMIIGQWDSANAEVNVNSGGTLNLNAGTDIQFATGNNNGTRVLNVDGGAINGSAGGGSYINLNNASTAGTSTMNIKNGGVVAVDAIIANSAGSTLNIDNGTIKATTSDPNLINMGAGSANVLSGGATIDTDGYDSTVVSGLLDGDGLGGGVTKNGDGTLTLLGANTYTGDTVVNAGGLLIAGSVAGNVNVASGATVGGTGSVAGDLSLATGALLAADEAAPLTVTGTLTLADTFSVADLGLNVDATHWTVGTYTLIDTVGDFSNIQNFGEANAVDIGANRQAYFQNGSLQLVVIPEPATLGMIGVFGAGMLFVRRRLMM